VDCHDVADRAFRLISQFYSQKRNYRKTLARMITFWKISTKKMPLLKTEIHCSAFEFETKIRGENQNPWIAIELMMELNIIQTILSSISGKFHTKSGLGSADGLRWNHISDCDFVIL
jgi:transcriptional accessory protein Tex/SPT6